MVDLFGNKKPCATCGKMYTPCVKCEEMRSQGILTWRATCDTVECFQVHLVLHGFYHNTMSKEEAKAHLDNLLTPEMVSYTDNARGLIEQIYHDEKREEPLVPISSQVAKSIPQVNSQRSNSVQAKRSRQV